MLTNGSLHGLALLARRLARGRNVVAEYPIYDRAERCCSRPRRRCSARRMDEEGVNADEIHNMLVQYSTPALIYTIPSFHNPTGWTLSLPRRRRLLELVRGQSMVQVQGMQIVEDDSYALTRFEGEGEHALFDLSGKTTIYLSSFSTTIAPGPARGLAHPPGGARRRHRRGRGRRVHHAVAAEPGDRVRVHHARQLRAPSRRAARRRCSMRRDAMLAALERHMPDGDVVASRRAATSSGWSCRASRTGAPCSARAEGVTAVAGTSFSAMSSSLRLSYAAATPDEIDAGVARLAAAL